MPTISEATMMLRLAEDLRFDGSPPAVWFSEARNIEDLLTICCAHMSHAGLDDFGYLPAVLDHALEILPRRTGASQDIDAGKLRGLAETLGNRFLPEAFRHSIAHSSASLAARVRAESELAAAPSAV